MKSNEITIGNWVLVGTKPVQVYPIMFMQLFRKDLEIDTEDYDVHPIPLTEEILEKNGFNVEFDYDFRGHSKSWYLKDNNKTLFMMSGDYKFSISSKMCKINYVHQLQNVLTLLKIDKQIVL